MTILQRLHDSEIEAQISFKKGSGFLWLVGSPIYAERVRRGLADNEEQALAAMAAAAVQLFPESNFAQAEQPA